MGTSCKFVTSNQLSLRPVGPFGRFLCRNCSCHVQCVLKSSYVRQWMTLSRPKLVTWPVAAAVTGGEGRDLPSLGVQPWQETKGGTSPALGFGVQGHDQATTGHTWKTENLDACTLQQNVASPSRLYSARAPLSSLLACH